ncbi:uncharacterized protein PAC_15113 [Phialocephala subalpina]|uniref:C2H2-type domain-containing protein n=1 Tax=Phialocephala subalpina TaxID=576137 RepID=A0A1L7XJL3_9HELO|nr:uncharacterized protein PAC_15113 [Phialocephala subalpina]
MANSKLTLLLALLLTFVTIGSAFQIDPRTGQILCVNLDYPGVHWCELRVTTQGDAHTIINGNWYNAPIDVYDKACNKIGGAWGVTGHDSIDSELRWTVELDIPFEWSDSNHVNFWYAGRQTTGPGACVTYNGGDSSSGLNDSRYRVSQGCNKDICHIVPEYWCDMVGDRVIAGRWKTRPLFYTELLVEGFNFAILLPSTTSTTTLHYHDPPYRVQLFDTSPNESWGVPQDQGIHDYSGLQSRKPLSLYAAPKPPPVSTPIDTFTQLSELPQELQLKIIGFCDEPTLYVNSGSHILSTFTCPVKVLPNVKRVVVLAQKTALNAGEEPKYLSKIFRGCPDTIASFAAFMRAEFITNNVRSLQYRSTLLRLPSSSWSEQWETIHHPWDRTLVDLPPKRIFSIEARERNNFDGRCIPFTCPHPYCDVRIMQAGDWTKHALAILHDRGINAKNIQPPLSPELHARLHSRMMEFREAKFELDADYILIKDQYNDAGSEERRQIEDEFASQLENDPLYLHRVPARECLTWQLARNSLFRV